MPPGTAIEIRNASDTEPGERVTFCCEPVFLASSRLIQFKFVPQLDCWISDSAEKAELLIYMCIFSAELHKGSYIMNGECIFLNTRSKLTDFPIKLPINFGVLDSLFFDKMAFKVNMFFS